MKKKNKYFQRPPDIGENPRFSVSSNSLPGSRTGVGGWGGVGHSTCTGAGPLAENAPGAGPGRRERLRAHKVAQQRKFTREAEPHNRV